MRNEAPVIFEMLYTKLQASTENDVRIALKSGESLALRGANQSGKSQTLKALIGLSDFDEGAIWVNGEPFSDLSKSQRQSLRKDFFGVSLISGHWVDDLSAFDNLTLAYHVQSSPSQKTAPSEWQARIHELIFQFELGHCEHRKFRHLSASERARLSIARAFVVEKPLIALDDPGAYLDPDMKKIIYDQIFNIQDMMKAALILTTSESYLSSRCDHCFDLNVKEWVR